MSLIEALTYLRGVGEKVEPVTTKRWLKRGWTFYSPSAQQAMDDAGVIEWARNAQEFHSA